MNLATLGLPTSAAPATPALPPLWKLAGPPAKPEPLKFHFRAFARYYVQRRMLERFNAMPDGRQFMLDLLVAVRHLRSMYTEYLERFQGDVVIDTDAFGELLSAAALARLRPKQVNEIKDLIQSEAGIYTRDLKNTMRLLAEAMSHASETMDVMDNKLDARIAEYCQQPA